MTAYDILGVTPNTPMNDIKKRYRKLCREEHPDNGGNADKFQSYVKAYDSIVNGTAIKLERIIHNKLTHISLFKFKVAE